MSASTNVLVSVGSAKTLKNKSKPKFSRGDILFVRDWRHVGLLEPTFTVKRREYVKPFRWWTYTDGIIPPIPEHLLILRAAKERK